MGASGVLDMLMDQLLEQQDILAFEDGIEIHAGKVAANSGKITILIEDVSNSTAHASAEIATGPAQNHDSTVCHVLATVVADSFYDRRGTGVPNGEPFASNSVEVSLPACCTIKDRVAD